MTTIKSYTDLEQSKKLTEILPLESADMIYIMYRNGEKPQNGDANLSTVYESSEHKWYWIDIIDESWDMRIGEDISCWSLAALFGILPTCRLEIVCGEYYKIYPELFDEHHSHIRGIFGTGSNLIDACYNLIIKLKDLNLL